MNHFFLLQLFYRWLPVFSLGVQLEAQLIEVDNVAELQQAVDLFWTQGTRDKLHSPGSEFVWQLPMMSTGPNFSQSFLDSLTPVQEEGILLYLVKIIETDETPITRKWMDLDGNVVATTTPPAGYDPHQWVLTTFPPPTNLTSGQLDEFVQDRHPRRKTFRLKLIRSVDLPDWEQAMVDRAVANGIPEEPENLVVGSLRVNPDQQGVELLTEIPFGVSRVGLYSTNNLLEPIQWTQEHTADIFSHPQWIHGYLDGNYKYYRVVNHSLDSDLDGLPDVYEQLISHTSPTLVDSDDDGVTDYVEIFLHQTDPHLKDTDGDGIDDGFEIENETRLGMLEDFDSTPLGQWGSGYLWYWSWGPRGDHWLDYSTIDVMNNGTDRYLRFWLSDNLLDANSHYDAPGSSANLTSVIGSISVAPYLMPKADAIRLKVKMLQGKIGLAFGAPVSQAGNSDVLTKVKYLSPSEYGDCMPLGDGWLQCDFDLNENLLRNTRRANFSGSPGQPVKNSAGEEIIHFTRWQQEPLTLFIVSYDSNGDRIISGDPVFFIDDIELINKGRGRDYPTFSPAPVIRTIETFNDSVTSAFTVDFDFPTSQPVPVLSLSNSSSNGSKSLRIQSKTAEENAWTGINATNANGANAVSFDLKIEVSASHPIDKHIIDFFIIATPDGAAFPWANFADDGEYDYVLSKAASTGQDFAIYHARRILPRDQWQKVIIPFADFAAAYGSGSMIDHHREQKPLMASEASTVGLQVTWAHRTVTTFMYVDNIDYVSVPGTVRELRSYWQGQAFSE